VPSTVLGNALLASILMLVGGLGGSFILNHQHPLTHEIKTKSASAKFIGLVGALATIVTGAPYVIRFLVERLLLH
jgi:hypothetical protein